MGFHEGKKEMVASADSDYSAACWHFDSVGPEFCIVAFYIRIFLDNGLGIYKFLNPVSELQ